jgi:hypothetical protein
LRILVDELANELNPHRSESRAVQLFLINATVIHIAVEDCGKPSANSPGRASPTFARKRDHVRYGECASGLQDSKRFAEKPLSGRKIKAASSFASAGFDISVSLE